MANKTLIEYLAFLVKPGQAVLVSALSAANNLSETTDGPLKIFLPKFLLNVSLLAGPAGCPR